MLVIGGCMIFFLWLLLPITPVLSSFDYPTTVADIDDPSKLLGHLQKTNDTLVRTTTILHLFMFIFVFIVLEALYKMTKLVGAQRSDS